MLWVMTNSAGETVTRDGIAETHERIAPYIRRTPVIEVEGADFGLSGVHLNFKLESLQHSGSFKARGAFANLLLREVPSGGVVAASGGNHGAAVAYGAQRLGIPATVFVPSTSSAAKRERISTCGAKLIVSGERYADALAASEEYLRQTPALAIHAYDQVETLLGAGTTGREFTEQGDIDTMLVAVGGGGLIGGIAAWLGGATKLVGVEPHNAPTLARALDAGEPVDTDVSGIAADSLGARRVGALMFPLAQRYVDHVALVSDDAIRNAQVALWETLRIVAEPGGAAAFAALLSGAYRPQPGERVGVLICGANTTAVDLSQPSA
jgi:threonine dehydratase